MLKLYERKSVYLAEGAQQLARNVNYEIPALKQVREGRKEGREGEKEGREGGREGEREEEVREGEEKGLWGSILSLVVSLAELGQVPAGAVGE